MEGDLLICKACGYDFIDFSNKKLCPNCGKDEFTIESHIEITDIKAWIE